MEYSVEGESISNIADAIRERSGSEDPMTLSQMPGLIRNLPGGGEGHKVTISLDSSSHQYSADADYATISEWITNNEYVYAEYNDGIYIPNYYSDSAIYFTRTNQSVGSNSNLDFQIFEIRVQGGPLGLNTRAIPRIYNPTSSNVGKYLKSVEVSSGIYAYEPSDLEFTITNGYSLREYNGYYRLPSDITVATIANRLKNGEFVFCYVYYSGSFDRIYIPWQASSSGDLTLYGVVNTVSGYPAYIEVLYGSAGNGFFSVNKRYSIPLKPSSNDAGKTIIVDSDGDPRWQNLPEKEQVISYADYMALTEEERNNGKSYYIYDAQNEGREIQPVIYSEDEREIGVWIDGKPLYEKTIVEEDVQLTTSSSYIKYTNFSYSELGLSNIDSIFIVTAFEIRHTGTVVRLNYSDASIEHNYSILHIRPQSNNAYYQTSLNGSDISKLIFTLRYTKTTDVAGSGNFVPSGVPAVHYDGNEKVIGTWFGETLYEKTFDFGENITFFSNQWTDTSISVSSNGINKIISVEAMNSGGTNWDMLGVNNDNTYVQIWNYRTAGEGAAITIRYLTLRYTKSTS